MKKILWSVATATLFFASCAKDATTEPVPAPEAAGDFTAQIDLSRTELDGTGVLWSEGDELTIFTRTAHNRQYRVKEMTDDKRTATFGFVGYTGTDNTAIAANYALYPYDATATLSGEVITTTLSAEQSYSPEKVDLANALMVAKSKDQTLSFVNAGALLRFKISKIVPDVITLQSIKVASAANHLAGKAEIDLAGEMKAVVTAEGTNEVTLTGIDTEITTEQQMFYMALPATTFAAEDLTVTFTFAEGTREVKFPAFELAQNSIKSYTLVVTGDDFTGTTPDYNLEEVSSLEELLMALANPDVKEITLMEDIEVTSGTNGLNIMTGKSFTLDLNGKTFKAATTNAAVRININNDEVTEPVVIDIKNGTIEAESSAYCALIAAGKSDDVNLTVNLSDVELTGAKSDGSVVKVFDYATINFTSGTVVTGKDSYGAIEVAGGVVNVYDGVKLYQNGTTSYNGTLIGVGGDGVANVYGGYGVSKKNCMIAMTSGGTINAMGGKWIANTDGTVPANSGDSNLNVLVAQNDRNSYPNATPSVINVTGGTYMGGISATGYTATSEAKTTISGGTFNANPANFLADGYTAINNDGNYVVTLGGVDTVVSSSEDLKAALASGKSVILTSNVAYYTNITKDATIDLNGNTFEATNTIKLSGNSDLTMVGGNYEINSSFGHVDIRPNSTEGSEVLFENVDFSFNKLNRTNGPCTNRLGSVVEVCAETTDANTVIKFKNCTFDNALVFFEGMSGKTGTFQAVFEDCTFTALTSSAPIEVQNYIKGTIQVINCKLNLTCTSSTASAISISSSTSTAVELTATNNTFNAIAATPYTYDASKGEDETYNVKVNGTPANIKFVSVGGTTSKVNETGTIKSGIAAL